MLRVQPLLDAGAVVTFSSDVNSLDAIAEANPYFGMQTAHNRQYRPTDPTPKSACHFPNACSSKI